MYEALQVASADGNQCPQLTHGAVVYMQTDLLFSSSPLEKKNQYLYQISKIMSMRLEYKLDFYEKHGCFCLTIL